VTHPIILLTRTAIYCLAVKRVYDIRSTKVPSDRIENFVSERMMGYFSILGYDVHLCNE
jgi:hypothetical protein